jgi:chemotaxis protein histidine kinase CheA
MSLSAFSDDPELVATFRAEVEERIGSLSAGLLALEGSGRQRDLLLALCRDAHTVKGSARMLGLDDVVSVAHGAEDLLAGLREGRVALDAEHVDALLKACDVISRALPGGGGVTPTELAVLLAQLQETPGRRGSTGGDGPVGAFQAPRVATSPTTQPAPERATVAASVRSSSPAGEEVRVNGRRVRALLDAVGEAELGGRRLLRCAEDLTALVGSASAAVTTLRRAGSSLPPQAQVATQRLTAALDQLLAAGAAARDLAEDHRDRLTLVREEAIGLAMVPMRHLLSGFPRLARALASEAGKEVRVETTGEGVELDKQVLDAVADALTHLVTNAVDHGLEPTAERVAAGKPAVGTVRVDVRSAGTTVLVEVSDDGRGVDVAAVRAAATACGLAADGDPVDLLFAPTLSTARTVTRSSGRGMGLDSVRSVVEGIGGSVSVHSEAGCGTTFTVTVPVTLGVLHCLVVRLGAERYAVPVAGVIETLSLRDFPPAEVGGAPVLVRDGTTLPLVDLAAALGVPGARPAANVLVSRLPGSGEVAWAVDALEGETEMVVGDLGSFLAAGVPGVSGVTIDSDGRVVCVLDLRETAAAGLLSAGSPVLDRPPERAVPRPVRPRVLVVEDSLGVRELERTVLEGAGYEVDTAVDGTDGAARLHGRPVDLVLTDVEMPGMTGFALTRAVRATPDWRGVPVVIMTSRGSEEDKREGLLAGASAYLLKQEFDQAQLVETVRRLVGR